MLEHAKKCEEWQRQKTSKRKKEVNTCMQERHECILERLRQLGYESEIVYFRPEFFRESRKKTKPLTDEGQLSPHEIALDLSLIADAIEWARMLHKWLKTMNYHRELRLNQVVYSPRRRLLAAQYDDYVKLRDTPIFDILPHVIDLARFPPFRDIINAPEGTQMGENPFASAFAQLPTLVGDWKKQLDAQLAELVTIPPHLYSQDALARRVVASSSVTSADKLRLACALFEVNCPHLFTHPEVFLIPQPRHSLWPNRDVSTPTESILDRFGMNSWKRRRILSTHVDWIQAWPCQTTWTVRMLD
ncbi:hypothetical protein JVT61DRAFT_622 [Boletus reticuloceps]|uniref:Uncharacterized protein n=1 Tax=Boletus reticuloceps TaxID=495285 RepID=A0A8I3ADX3_9AGAM|nr:hypothetical protein JVT61DRAFT_622 [Boletus reticuloceps]